jgi:hypothetical protein
MKRLDKVSIDEIGPGDLICIPAHKAAIQNGYTPGFYFVWKVEDLHDNFDVFTTSVCFGQSIAPEHYRISWVDRKWYYLIGG